MERLLFYTECLVTFQETGRKQFSSSEIAKRLKLKPTLVRKDLSYIGPLGRRGTGFNIEKVLKRINQVVYTKKSVLLHLLVWGISENRGLETVPTKMARHVLPLHFSLQQIFLCGLCSGFVLCERRGWCAELF
ncbi:hypothetical protein KAW18_07855 [candidate division WOR-3 bacterium]|nr:hypothetical protein [candidate division WOR-3 bacterium]